MIHMTVRWALALAITLPMAASTSCAVDSGFQQEPAETSAIVAAGATVPAVVSDHRAQAIDLARARLSGESATGQLDPIPLGPAAERMAAASEGSRELLSLLVACALPAQITLASAAPGADLEFFGEVGLAPGWVHRALSSGERRWVSACVLARLSQSGLATVASLRGPIRVLRAPAGERDAFPVEEGAFYGDLFVPADRPIEWVACRGTGRDAGGLLDRACALEDPDRPGLTRCRFRFVGDCADACGARGRDGYRRCRLPGGGNSDQVVSAFVVP